MRRRPLSTGTSMTGPKDGPNSTLIAPLTLKFTRNHKRSDEPVDKNHGTSIWAAAQGEFARTLPGILLNTNVPSSAWKKLRLGRIIVTNSRFCSLLYWVKCIWKFRIELSPDNRTCEYPEFFCELDAREKDRIRGLLRWLNTLRKTESFSRH